MLDPYIIPQKWGGNLWTNSVDVQSNLLGIDKQLGRDCVDKTPYKRQTVHTSPILYPTSSVLTTEQSRAIAPAWMVRDKEQVDWYYPPLDPQENTCMPFNNNLSTRILEKDYFTPKRDCVINEVNNQQEPSHDLIR